MFLETLLVHLQLLHGKKAQIKAFHSLVHGLSADPHASNCRYNVKELRGNLHLSASLSLSPSAKSLQPSKTTRLSWLCAEGKSAKVISGKAYEGRSFAALKPQPFFSVRMTSTSACCFLWNRRLEQCSPFGHLEELSMKENNTTINASATMEVFVTYATCMFL